MRSVLPDFLEVNVVGSSLLEVGLKVSEAYRVLNATDEQKKARSAIVALFFASTNVSPGFTRLFDNERRVDFLFALMFEMVPRESAISLISRGFRTAKPVLPCRTMNKILKIALDNVRRDTRWRELVSELFDLITESVPFNPAVIITAVIRTRLSHSLSRVPEGLMATDNKTVVLGALNRTIDFFSSLCNFSRDVRACLTSSSWSLVKSLRAPLLYADLDPCCIDGLIAFTEYRGHLAIPEGIELLFCATEKEAVREQVLQYLVDMTRTSVANRYQCFRANVLDGLLKQIALSPSPTALTLFSQLGSSFFRISEFSLTLRLISQSQNASALPVLQAILMMLNPISGDVPTSFFNLHDRDQFRIRSVCVPSTFTIEMHAAFFASDEGARVFLSLGNSVQKLELILDTTKLVASMVDGVRSYQFRLCNGIGRNCWYRFKIAITPTVISLSVNGELQTSSVIPSRFRFDEAATLELGQFFWALASFTLNGDDRLFRAHFNAKCVSDLKCHNAIPGTAIQYAEYDGLPVPYLLSFVDALSTSGGVLVLLPLFEVVGRSSEPYLYLKTLLKLVSGVLEQKQQLFVAQRFFRSLGSLMSRIGLEYLTLDCIELLYEMYKRLRDRPTRLEMLRYIFANFAIWNNMDADRQNFIFAAIFPGLLELDPDTFVDALSFGDLLIEFTVKFSGGDKSEASQDLAQRCWRFLHVLSSVRMDGRDAELLIASALRIIHEETCSWSLRLMVNLISDRSREFLRVLNGLRVFPPLLMILTSPSETVRLTAISAIAYTWLCLRTTDFGVEMVDAIRLLSLDNMTCRSSSHVLSAMTEHVSFEDFGFITKEFRYDVVKPIGVPQLLPLLCAAIYRAPSEEVARATAYVRAAAKEFVNYRPYFDKSPQWVFWALFLSLCDGCREEWLETIRLVAGTSGAVIHNASLLRCLGAAMTFPTAENVISILAAAVARHPTLELAKFTIQNLLFTVECQADAEPLETSIHLCAKSLITMSQVTVSAAFAPCMRSDVEYGLSVVLVTYLIAQDQAYFSEPSLAGDCPMSTMICYLLHRIARHRRNVAADVLKLTKTIFGHLQWSCLAFSTAFYILLDFLPEGMALAKTILSHLREVDPALEGFTDADLRGRAQDITAKFEMGLAALAPAVGEALRTHINRAQDELREALMRIFEDRNIALARVQARFANEIRGLNLERARNGRADAKFWRTTIQALSQQNGGPWSQIGDAQLHFKFDDSADSFWRRNRLKVNLHFDDHKEASLLRDSGAEIEEKTVYRAVVASEDEVVDVPVGHALELDCEMITATRYFRGTLYLSSMSIAFEAKQTTNAVGDPIDKAAKLIEIGLDSVLFVLKRRYMHADRACEVFTCLRKSRFFIFSNSASREEFFKSLKALKPKRLKFVQTGDAIQIYNDLKLLKRWNLGELSNYEYLYWLNLLSGRSIHDLSQYPVFPWVIRDYRCETLEFYGADMYRDLAQSIGPLNTERIQQLKWLFRDTRDQPFACLYRFHYSAPAYVIGFLVRKEPFTSLHIQLQNGRFDLANRLFWSIPEAWKSVTSTQNDFRELIPEFFANPEFLLNSDGYDLGLRAFWEYPGAPLSHMRVGDVELPPWAPSAAAFVALNRIALESVYVSSHLHEWIDLVFGFKQRSEDANTCFHPWSYCESIQDDPDDIAVIQEHALNFGITPSRLFKGAHSQRKFQPPLHSLLRGKEGFLKVSPLASFDKKVIKVGVGSPSAMLLFEDGGLSICTLTARTELSSSRTIQLEVPPVLSPQRIFTVPARSAILVSPRWAQNFTLLHSTKRKFEPSLTHSTPITALAIDGDFCVTAASDSSIYVWNLEEECVITTIVAHTCSIAAVGMLARSEIVVSCDISGNLVMSALRTGAFLNKSKLDRVPVQIHLADLGFCCLIFVDHPETGAETEVVLTDFSARVLARRTFEGECSAAKVIVNSDASAFLVVAQETTITYIMSVWDLTLVALGPVSGTVTDIAYCPNELTLMFVLDSGELHAANFAIDTSPA
jgi:hypothetical protein